jgi:hypothetical protein
MTDGILQSHALFIDTTHTRLAGDLQVDFHTGELGGNLEPRAKRPRLFAVSTPLRISGTLGKPQVSVKPLGVATGTLRLYLFAPTLAVDWLSARNLPDDGTPDCRATYGKLKD